MCKILFDGGAGRNILLSRYHADSGVPGVFFSSGS